MPTPAGTKQVDDQHNAGARQDDRIWLAVEQRLTQHDDQQPADQQQ